MAELDKAILAEIERIGDNKILRNPPFHDFLDLLSKLGYISLF